MLCVTHGATRMRWPGACLVRCSAFDDLLIHEVIRVDCARWFDGRLALVGDAAHAMAPNLGQGANSALVDAAVLVHALRSHGELGAALAAYDARRRQKVRAVADASERLGKLSEATHAVVRTVRDRVLMPVLGLLPQERQLRMLLQESPEALREMVYEARTDAFDLEMSR